MSSWTVLPSPVTVVAKIATRKPEWLERYLHVAFAHRRVRGEWFRLADEELGLLIAIPAADAEADLPVAVVALWQQKHARGFSLHPLWRRAVLPTPRCRARKKPRGRPKAERKNTGVYVEYPPDLLAEAKAFAADRGLKFKDVVVDALRRHLRYPPPRPEPSPEPAPLPDAEPAPAPNPRKRRGEPR